MHNGPSVRTLIAPGMHMSHHVVPQFAFVPVCRVEVDVINVGSHLGKLGVGDVQSELLLTFGQCYPQATPCGVFFLCGPDGGHFAGGVAGDQRVFVDVVGHCFGFQSDFMDERFGAVSV